MDEQNVAAAVETVPEAPVETPVENPDPQV